ncbi:hypothetical protein [Pectinatus frisingensis]|uniref:hypothetical protein n=1 Tax=Pectinatus frisingensis TaxID=865 RepID=UPI0018C84801|nr:hypothetical protein [Pectinatus frisingensis]
MAIFYRCDNDLSLIHVFAGDNPRITYDEKSLNQFAIIPGYGYTFIGNNSNFFAIGADIIGVFFDYG